ncbi:hypothetical protein [Streptacidiphilus sp. MAP12-20]|uniref:hypothetical protein n=1 Tax=Streptacidiphilus sp. MAP12-20 TaxID=3156299 RepID=UPI0035143B30
MALFNEWLAVKATNVFGSMGLTYLFFGYGFVPALVPSLMVTLLYWSNTIPAETQTLRTLVADKSVSEAAGMLKISSSAAYTAFSA